MLPTPLPPDIITVGICNKRALTVKLNYAIQLYYYLLTICIRFLMMTQPRVDVSVTGGKLRELNEKNSHGARFKPEKLTLKH